MGRAATATVFYGIAYDYETPDADRFTGADDDTPEDDSPAAMVYYGEPKGCRVRAITYGGGDLNRYAIAAAGTVTRGRDWQATELRFKEPPADADDVLRAWCEKRGLTYRKPRWFVVPYYG